MASLWNLATGIKKDVEHVFQNGDLPKPGDMIHFQMFVFQHWGIYIGEEEVVHFAWPRKRKVFYDQLVDKTGVAWVFIDNNPVLDRNSDVKWQPVEGFKFKVRKDKIKDVWGVFKSAVWNKFDDKYPPLEPTCVVKRARHMVNKVLRYNLANANCEHFATLMRYNKALSGQAERFNYTVAPDFEQEIRRYLAEVDCGKSEPFQRKAP